jgi:hypothetical protein
MHQKNAFDKKGLFWFINPVQNHPSKTGGRHGERTQTQTAKQKLADVIRWAERQGFLNVAEELRSILAAMPDE